MRNEGDEEEDCGRASEEQGWRVVRDYCQRFRREHLLQPYLQRASHLGDRPRTHRRAMNDDDRKSKSSEDINADTSYKGGSPDSGVTSRKLEWDSLADIGYENVKLIDSQYKDGLSTIERIVLNKNFSKNASRSATSERELNLSSPNAQSTPTVDSSKPESSKCSVKNVNFSIEYKSSKEPLLAAKASSANLEINSNVLKDESSNVESEKDEITSFLTSDDNVLMSADSFEFVAGHAYKNNHPEDISNKRDIFSSQSDINKSPDHQNDNISGDSSKEKVYTSNSVTSETANRDDSNRNYVKIDKELSKKITVDGECQTEFVSDDINDLSKLEKISLKTSTDSKNTMKTSKSESSSMQISPKSVSSISGSNLNEKLHKIKDKITRLMELKEQLENKQSLSKRSVPSISRSDSGKISPSSDVCISMSIPLLNLKSSSEDLYVGQKDLTERKKSNESDKRSQKDKKLLISKNNTETYTKGGKSETETEKSSCEISESDNLDRCSAANLFSSSRSSSVDSKDSRANLELKRFEKAYLTYKKCKNMQSFLKEYDELIKKYKAIKTNSKKSRFYTERKEMIDKENNSKSMSSSSSCDDRVILKEICETMKRFEDKLNRITGKSLSKIDCATQIQSSSMFSNDSESHKSISGSIREASIPSFNTQTISKNCHNAKSSYRNTCDRGVSPIIFSAKSNDKKSFKKEASNLSNHARIKDSKCCLNCKNPKIKSRNCACSKSDKKDYPKPLAYDLMLKSSDSILHNSNVESEKKPLDVYVVKVPKLKSNPKNSERVLCDFERESTDSQPDNLSSLNDDRISDLPLDNDHKVPEKEKVLTVKEYLEVNRPQFINRANQRRFYIKELINIRNEQEELMIKKLEGGAVNMCKSQMEYLIKLKHHNRALLMQNRLFDCKEIKKNTEKQYKKLPEILNKHEKMKKQSYKKTNRLMAELFVKKLQQRALKGVVNNPLYVNVMEL